MVQAQRNSASRSVFGTGVYFAAIAKTETVLPLQSHRAVRELLKMLRKSEWERFNRIRASTRNHNELKRALGSFIEYHTERNLKSLRFIESVLG